MATFLATSNNTIGGVDFTTFSIADLLGLAGHDRTTFSATTFRLSTTGDLTSYNEFSGLNFSYDVDGNLIGGTINSFIVFQDGIEVYRVTGLQPPLDAAAAHTF